MKVFHGEYLRNNDGTHLDGKIVDDKVWQERYISIIIYPLSQYDLPTNGTIGKSFLLLLAKEIDGLRERKWNMEKVICFMSMILQRSPDLKGAGNIKRRIKQRILDWNDKKYEMLRGLHESKKRRSQYGGKSKSFLFSDM